MIGGLALWGTAGSLEVLRPLLVQVSRQCPVTAFDPAEPPHAVLVDAAAVLPDEVAAQRLVRWTASADEAARAVDDERVLAVLTTDAGALSAAGPLGILVPTLGPLEGDVRPVPPHVRARLTVSRGLPSRAIADCTGGRVTWDGQEVDAASTDTALAAAAVVVTDDPTVLLRALAWAAPCVVAPEAARALGVADDVEVVAPDDGRLREAAVDLAHDVHRAARLSLTGRLWFERTADVGQAATRLVAQIGFVRPGLQRIDQLYAQLGSSPAARSYQRAAALISSLDARAGV
jgi:hypothetical protein